MRAHQDAKYGAQIRTTAANFCHFEVRAGRSCACRSHQVKIPIKFPENMKRAAHYIHAFAAGPAPI
jgi:hypothetical protein